MAFLENLGKAAQAAAKKSGELVEVTKLNVNINSEEDKIQKLYAQIGKSIYEKFAATGETDDEIRQTCEAISVHEQSIKNLKDKIADVKGTKQCIGCGTEMEKAQIFCSKCGARNEVATYASAVPAQQAATVVCPACGATLPAESAFCTSCGAKIG